MAVYILPFKAILPKALAMCIWLMVRLAIRLSALVLAVNAAYFRINTHTAGECQQYTEKNSLKRNSFKPNN